MGQGVQRAQDPHTRGRGASDQIVRDRLVGDVGPLVDPCVERKRGSLRPTEMGGHDETVRVGFVDDGPKHLKRGNRPRLYVGTVVLMLSSPRRARRTARLHSDLDERGTAGDVAADCGAGRLDVRHLDGGVGAEHRDRIATGRGEDRPGAEHS